MYQSSGTGNGRRRGVMDRAILTVTAAIGFSLALLPGALATEGYGAFSDPSVFPIGGGAGYSAVVTNGDTIEPTGAALSDALANATNGQVLFIPGDAVIDMTDYLNTVVPAGVTLASDRGYNGSPGALLYITNRPAVFYHVLHCGAGARITGLRIRGADDSVGSINYLSRPKSLGGAIGNVSGSGEIDNCEISHFWRHGVHAAYGAYIHHNSIHDIHAYPILAYQGQIVAEANYIVWLHHALDAAENRAAGYTAQYNFLFKRLQPALDDLSEPFKSHPAGTLSKTNEIFYNTLVDESELPDVHGIANLDPANPNLTAAIACNEFPVENLNDFFLGPAGTIRTNNLYNADLRYYYYACWQFDATTGIDAIDSSIMQNHAVLSGGVSFVNGSVAGQILRGLALDGQDDYVDAGDPDDGNLDFGTGNFTLSAWICLEAQSGTQSLFCKRDNDQGYSFSILDGGVLQAELKTIGQASCIVTSTVTISTNQWHHVAAVYDRLDSGRMYLYLDGEAVGSVDCSSFSGAVDNGYAFLMGAAGNSGSTSSHFKGALDQARAYGRALTSAEMHWAHQKGRMAGWWKLNESVGTWAYDAAEIAHAGVLQGGGSFASNAVIGKESTGLQFDGVDDYLNISDPVDGSLDFGNANFSVMAWFFCPELPTGYDYIIGKQGGGGQGYVMYLDQSASQARLCCRFSTYDGSHHYTISRKNFNVGQWNHAAMVVDRTNGVMKIYLNGGLIDTKTITNCTGTAAQEHPFRIGAVGTAASAGSFFYGAIDDVRVYNGTMDAGQVSAIVDSYDLVGHWTLDETLGTAAKDSSFFRNDGVLCNGLDFAVNSVSGQAGTALAFDGVDDYVNVSDPIDGSLDFDSTSFSVAAWFYCPELPTGYDYIIGKQGGGGQGYVMYLDQSASQARLCCRFSTYDGSHHYSISRKNITVGQWNHTAMVVDRTTNSVMKIYLNGGLIDTKTITNCTGTAAQEHPFRIGAVGTAASPGNFFHGAIDDVRVYRKVLSEGEIEALIP